jgi:Cys-rich repeat protein
MCLPPPGCDPASGAPCPPVCGGLCVGNTTIGCKSDAECPSGQRCDMMCAGWACAPDPTYPSCECPPDFPDCTCDAAGGCYGQECSGQCVPTNSTCTGTCDAPRCANPVTVGTDACGCPVYECTNCSTPQGGTACPVVDCYCAQQVGYDESCCPIVYCPPVAPPEACPAGGAAPACGSDLDCAAGQVCLGGVCANVALPLPAGR